MEITARLTADARVNTLKDERQVVNFNVVVNDYYKDKSGNRKEIATFFNCGYWRSAKVAASLKKGKIVLLHGRVDTNVWTNASGEAKASLVFHVSNITFIGGGKADAAAMPATASAAVVDDLPF